MADPRFIDAEARFAFVADKKNAAGLWLAAVRYVRRRAHPPHGCGRSKCCAAGSTFATRRWPGWRTVYDLNSKDGRFGAAGADTVGAVIEGLRRAHQDDHTLLEHGITLFEALYRLFGDSVHPRRRRPAVRRSSAPKTLPTRRKR